MSKQSTILRFLFISVFFMLICCNTSDDNNPSPVPDARDKFVGAWNVNNESCSKGKYGANISKDPSNSIQVLIQNFAFANAGEPDTAIIAGGSIHIYKQINSEGWTIEGNGTYNIDGNIDWNYSLIISNYEETCTATYVSAKEL
ncbi:MAG: hypothetical protein HQ565_03840 [Bacteroidetes bacterium]|nr:hypothetical protein [Bacteroidota bacterium]